MTLYEIDAAIMGCIDEETGEVIDPAKLDELQLEREQKIEGVALWIKNLTAEAKAIKEEKQALADRQRAAEKKVESLKEWLTGALVGQKFTTAKCAVNFRRTKSVEITNLLTIPIEYLRMKDPEPDKKAIKEALDAGEVIEGAAIVESVSCSIK